MTHIGNKVKRITNLIRSQVEDSAEVAEHGGRVEGRRRELENLGSVGRCRTVGSAPVKVVAGKNSGSENRLVKSETPQRFVHIVIVIPNLYDVMKYFNSCNIQILVLIFKTNFDSYNCRHGPKVGS